VKKFHEQDTGYYQVEFWSSTEVAEHGEDAEREEMMLTFSQFDPEKIKRHAKIHGWDTVKITKCQEITTWYQLEEEK
jgi:hypothetical protein